MSGKLHTFRLTVTLTLMLLASCDAIAKYAGGTGLSSDPYLILTPKDLAQIGKSPEDWDKHFKLLADVDMNNFNGIGGEPSFPIIGYLKWEPYESKPFKGVFDGNNKKIFNLSITSVGRDFVGLFGYINSPTACVKDLTIVNPYINSTLKMFVGAVAGKVKTGTISNCVVDGGSVYGGYNVGGLVGCIVKGIIKNCSVNTKVSGSTDVGGVVGYNFSAEITRCRFSGYVRGTQDVGGLAGECDGRISFCGMNGTVSGIRDKVAGLVGTLRGQLKASFAKGQITGVDGVGGLVGRNSGYIEDCYASGSVSGDDYIGGLVGFIYNGGSVSRCYAGCDVNAAVNEAWQLSGWAQINSVTASFWPNDQTTTSQMMLSKTYIDAGWDFVGETKNGNLDLWDICEESSFPRLAWQGWPAGDFQCPQGVDINDLIILAQQWLVKTIGIDNAGSIGDGVVNFRDLAVFASAWRSKIGQPSFNSLCDLGPTGGDGVIDVLDLEILADNWLVYGTNTADLSDVKGDGVVNFIDLVLFANAWRASPGLANWDPRFDIEPQGGDGVVNIDDFVVFADHWLLSPAGFADIAPANHPDGIVNMLDFALAAQNYLNQD